MTSEEKSCAACEQSIADVVSKQAKFLEEHGFYVHHVFDDLNVPSGYNIHTHGLTETFQHPDFQIVIPLSYNVAQNILHNIVDLIKEGRTFSSGEITEGIIKNFSVKFVEANENGRKVLRIIFPDPEGNILAENINEEYSVQYADII